MQHVPPIVPQIPSIHTIPYSIIRRPLDSQSQIILYSIQYYGSEHIKTTDKVSQTQIFLTSKCQKQLQYYIDIEQDYPHHPQDIQDQHNHIYIVPLQYGYKTPERASHRYLCIGTRDV